MMIFEKYKKAEIIKYGSLSQRFEESAEIVNKAINDVEPYAICLMLSGGDDSITALNVALMMGVKIDFVIHGVTGTGLPEVREFVRKVCKEKNLNLIEADAGNAFEKYVMRKGFFGRGNDAHKYSYHILKVNPFDTAISKYIRKNTKGRKIILLNGVRIEESENRADNFGDNPFRWQKNNLWVNIIHWWSKKECLQLLEKENIKRNPVSIALNRSGECNCGTMQTKSDIMLAMKFNPDWGKWMMNLRKQVIEKFGWDICEQPNKEIVLKSKTTDDFMPMCVGCKSRQLKLAIN